MNLPNPQWAIFIASATSKAIQRYAPHSYRTGVNLRAESLTAASLLVLRLRF